MSIGVMVAQEILVLLDKVRILNRQQRIFISFVIINKSRNILIRHINAVVKHH